MMVCVFGLVQGLVSYLSRLIGMEEDRESPPLPPLPSPPPPPSSHRSSSTYARYCLTFINARRQHCRRHPPSTAEFEVVCSQLSIYFNHRLIIIQCAFAWTIKEKPIKTEFLL